MTHLTKEHEERAECAGEKACMIFSRFFTVGGFRSEKGQAKSPNPLILKVSRAGIEPATR